MSPQEQRKYYETYFNLFLTDGWKQLIEDVEDSAQTVERSTVYNANTERELHHAKGSLMVYNYLLRLEESLRDAYDILEADLQYNEEEEL